MLFHRFFASFWVSQTSPADSRADSPADIAPLSRGKKVGPIAKICVDNCGDITQGELERGLLSLIPDIERVKLVTYSLGKSDTYRAGWAVVYTRQAAVERVLEMYGPLR